MNKELKQNNYILVKEMIPSERAEMLAAEFENFAKNSPMAIYDEQCPKSIAMYDFMPFVRLMVELTPKMNGIVKEQLLPTYAYSRVYQNGEILDRHLDRPACEISMTMNLSQDRYNWPIFIKNPQGEEKSINLNPGDALVYRGTVAEHWRDSFQGEKHIQVFMHYVRAFGENCWAYFDKRK
jgi:hypothetical protein